MLNKIKKSVIVILSVVCVCVFVVLFFVNDIVEHKLKASLEDVPESVHFTYTNLQVNVFKGMLFMENPELELL